jgi:hypothetical protein
VAEIVSEADALYQVRINEKVFPEKRGSLFQKRRDGPPNLGDFE